MAEQLGYCETQDRFNEIMEDYVHGEIKSELALRKKLNGAYLRLHAENKLDIMDAWQCKTPKALLGKMIRDARSGRRLMERED